MINFPGVLTRISLGPISSAAKAPMYSDPSSPKATG